MSCNIRQVNWFSSHEEGKLPQKKTRFSLVLSSEKLMPFLFHHKNEKEVAGGCSMCRMVDRALEHSAKKTSSCWIVACQIIASPANAHKTRSRRSQTSQCLAYIPRVYPLPFCSVLKKLHEVDIRADTRDALKTAQIINQDRKFTENLDIQTMFTKVPPCERISYNLDLLFSAFILSTG